MNVSGVIFFLLEPKKQRSKKEITPDLRLADALFWQLSIDHNIDVQLVFSWAPKLAKSVRVNIGFPVVWTYSQRLVYGHVITKVDLLSYGAPLLHIAPTPTPKKEPNQFRNNA